MDRSIEGVIAILAMVSDRFGSKKLPRNEGVIIWKRWRRILQSVRFRSMLMFVLIYALAENDAKAMM
jgi:hypothetical protein